MIYPLQTAAEKGTPVDLNNATLEELVKLPRIGPAVAKRVIEFRKENGGFHRVEELRNVRGIGPKSFELLREMVTDLPEVAGIVRRYGAGLVIPHPEPALIVAEVRALMADPAHRGTLRQKAIFAASALDGEREKEGENSHGDRRADRRVGS